LPSEPELPSLDFENLAARHPIDAAQLRCYANAARVRLDVHHSPPPTPFELTTKGETTTYSLSWSPVDDKLRRSYQNADDAKRDGAYVIAFAAVEIVEGLVSVARTETQTGADYYLLPKGMPPDDLESAVRLEVSGTDGEPSTVRARLKAKQKQTQDGKGTEPAIAAVVGFKSRLILVEWA
jgi:hypothetical protein